MQAFIKKNKWCVLLSGALIQVFTGVPAAWGAFQKSVQAGYNLNQNDTALIFSFTITSFGIFSIVGGAMQDKLGPRITAIIGAVFLGGGFCLSSLVPQGGKIWFYFAFSLNVGAGCGLLTPSVLSCVQKWYKDKKGFATGVIGLALGASGAVLTLSSKLLTKIFGIQATFLILGIVMFCVSCVCAIFLVNPNDEKQKKIHGSGGNYTALQILKTYQYYLVFFVVGLATPCVILFSPIIVELGTQRGLSEQAALLCIIIGSAFSAMGRLLMPWLSDKIGRKNTDLILFAALALLSWGFIYAKSYFVIVVYCLLAFCYSGEAAVIPSIATDLYGHDNAGVNYGLLALGMSAGSVVFPLIANSFDNIAVRHTIAIISPCIAFALLLFLKPTQGKRI